MSPLKKYNIHNDVLVTMTTLQTHYNKYMCYPVHMYVNAQVSSTLFSERPLRPMHSGFK